MTHRCRELRDRETEREKESKREREQEREREGGRERGREGERASERARKATIRETRGTGGLQPHKRERERRPSERPVAREACSPTSRDCESSDALKIIVSAVPAGTWEGARAREKGGGARGERRGGSKGEREGRFWR